MQVNEILARTHAIRFISVSSSSVSHLAFQEYFLIAYPTEEISQARRGKDRDCAKLHRLGNKAGIHFQSAGKE